MTANKNTKDKDTSKYCDVPFIVISVISLDYFDCKLQENDNIGPRIYVNVIMIFLLPFLSVVSTGLAINYDSYSKRRTRKTI